MSRAPLLLSLFICLNVLPAPAAPTWPAPAAAESYVQLALQQNLALQGSALDIDSARARLSLAQAASQPRLDLGSRYSRADGGRTIDVPSGDLLNPVYQTLNDSLVAQGKPAAFPFVSNLAIPLLREREQDTRLRLTAPLFSAELAQVRASRRAALESTTFQQAAARRHLRLTVLCAYYDYLSARAAEQTLQGATENTREAVRVSRALLDSDKVTEDRVLLAEADDLTVAQQLADITRDRRLAQHTLNLLLRRPLDAAVEEPSTDEMKAITNELTTRALPEPTGSGAREELAAHEANRTEASAAEAAARARARPTFAVVLDGGIQGESYRFGSRANYTQGSVIAEWNLWDGRRQRSERELARAERRKVDLRTDALRHQLTLEAQTAVDEMLAARSAMPAAQRRAEATARAFTLVTGREREGVANQLALLDARQARTAALLNLEITRLRLFVAAARIDRAVSASPIP